jgi:hypothetical protein
LREAFESERRQAERRAYAVDEDLRAIGWALVRRDVPDGRPWIASGGATA